MSDPKPRSIIYLCTYHMTRSRDRLGCNPIDTGYTEDCADRAVKIYEDSVVLNGNGQIIKAAVVPHE